jgi:hypothetical protein
MSASFSAEEVEKIWCCDDNEAMALISKVICGDPASSQLHAASLLSAIFLDNIRECRNFGCSSEHTAGWLRCLTDVLSSRIVSEAPLLLERSLATLPPSSTPPEHTLIQLIEFLKRTLVPHIPLIRYCLENAREQETFTATIELPQARPTPSFSNAVELSHEKAQAAFRRALNR